MKILYIIAAILLLCVIILLHEFGHYFVGRRLGIGIKEFSLGMGPCLWKTVKRKKIARSEDTEEIRYSLRLIPIGGYCAFTGEDGESDDPHSMNNQPAWKRFLTVIAGPFMNFLVAFVLATVLICSGKILNPFETEIYPYVSEVMEGMPADQAGFESGDIIVSIDGIPIEENGRGVELLKKTLNALPEGESVLVTVMRTSGEEENGEVELELVPVRDEATGEMLLGVQLPVSYAQYRCNLWEAVPESFRLMWNTAKETVKMLGQLLRALVTGGEVQEGTVSGVVGVVATVSDGMQQSFSTDFASGLWLVLSFIMAISLSLGLMNSLPFPALDGGRALLLLVEMVTGKHLSRKAEGYINLIGLGLLLVLIVFVTFSDIRSLIR